VKDGANGIKVSNGTPEDLADSAEYSHLGRNKLRCSFVSFSPIGGLVKMLYRAGFPVVYRVTPLPNLLLASSRPIVCSTDYPRIGRFLAISRRRQYLTMALRARRLFSGMPIPLLPFGAWWLAKKGALDRELMCNLFEETEIQFVKRLVRPGMAVLDVGASWLV